VLFRVFFLLAPSAQELISLSGVCRRWYDVASTPVLWQQACRRTLGCQHSLTVSVFRSWKVHCLHVQGSLRMSSFLNRLSRRGDTHQRLCWVGLVCPSTLSLAFSSSADTMLIVSMCVCVSVCICVYVCMCVYVCGVVCSKRGSQLRLRWRWSTTLMHSSRGTT
jgi:F-box-like